MIASNSQTLKHFVHPMQATEQYFLAIPPFSVLIHETNMCLSFLFCFLSSIISLGQASTQAPQAVQFSSITTGRPVFLFIYMASNSHTTTQSSIPRHPTGQSVSPIYNADATAHDEAPS